MLAVRPATEDDLRLPQFRGTSVDEYEVGPDGFVVRKDRWEVAVRSALERIANVAGSLGDAGGDPLVALERVLDDLENAERRPKLPEFEQLVPRSTWDEVWKEVDQANRGFISVNPSDLFYRKISKQVAKALDVHFNNF